MIFAFRIRLESPFRRAVALGMFGMTLALCIGFAPQWETPLAAQDSTPILDGSVTGELAHAISLGTTPRTPQPTLQPVKFLLPEGGKIAVAQEGGFVADETAPGLFAFLPGRVYRLKITDIPGSPGQELYPTVEMLARLSPPSGRLWEFPVEIDLTTEDLTFAAEGNLVTRVVYLESPDTALPISTGDGVRLAFDVPVGANPVAVARTRGIVMAIVRVGSRLPEQPPTVADPFYYGLAPFALPTVSTPFLPATNLPR